MQNKNFQQLLFITSWHKVDYFKKMMELQAISEASTAIYPHYATSSVDKRILTDFSNVSALYFCKIAPKQNS